MKISHPKFNTVLEFRRQEITSVVIEDKAFYEEFIVDIYKQINRIEESMFFSEEDKIKNMDKEFDFIASTFDLSYSDKKIQKNLIKLLSDEIYESDISLRLLEAYSAISSALEQLKLSCQYEIDYDNDLIITDIFKNFNVNIEQPSGRFVEKLLDYIPNMHDLTGKDIFVIANCDVFLENDDYVHIEKMVKYHNVAVIFVRNEQIELPIRQNEYIIDIDFCELH